MEKLKDLIRPIARVAVYFPLAAAIAACGTVEKVGNWWSGEAQEAPRLAPGMGEYLCEGGKSFQVRFDAATKSAWVKFPDREFRLDAVAGEADARYTNGRSTLNTKGDEAFLTEGTAVSYANCKRSASG